ncbi:MAG: aromatic ring hydroxylase [Bacillota bacterium]|nr:aromatic ring hydroxylase [Bacillota bacterium]REJ37985.1 MAG: aromatic ring hydroxylase [Bacillota bacterium]
MFPLVDREQVLAALKQVKDPEIPINIVDLGLVYRLDISDDGVVDMDMTLTTLGCPAAPQILEAARLAVESVEGVREARVNLVWMPPWTPDRMSERAKRALGRA